MKKLTIEQAARELNALAKKRLTGGPDDAFLAMRLEQFTDAVGEAITNLQDQVRDLQQAKTQKDQMPD